MSSAVVHLTLKKVNAFKRIHWASWGPYRGHHQWAGCWNSILKAQDFVGVCSPNVTLLTYVERLIAEERPTQCGWPLNIQELSGLVWPGWMQARWAIHSQPQNRLGSRAPTHRKAVERNKKSFPALSRRFWTIFNSFSVKKCKPVSLTSFHFFFSKQRFREKSNLGLVKPSDNSLRPIAGTMSAPLARILFFSAILLQWTSHTEG